MQAWTRRQVQTGSESARTSALAPRDRVRSKLEARSRVPRLPRVMLRSCLHHA